MADIVLTPIEEVDDEIQDIVNSLKHRLNSSFYSSALDTDNSIDDLQTKRIRNLIFTNREMSLIEEASLSVYTKSLILKGARLPVYDATELVDVEWVKRYNQAIYDGDQELAMRILVDKEDLALPDPNTSVCCSLKNEYCEIEFVEKDDEFNNTDRIKALLWYLNYVFFIENRNIYDAYHMVRERKKKNTIFPVTSPWYFIPTLKGAWEQQPLSDRFVDYFEQELLIPFNIQVDNVRIPGCHLRVNNNYIDEIVLVSSEGEEGDRTITISVEDIIEKYEHVSTPNDLQIKMAGSAIGSIEVVSAYATNFLLADGLQSYIKDTFRITRTQLDVFVLAYYGDYINKPAWVSLNIAPERRIRLEGWEADYAKWISISRDVQDAFLDLLFLNPLGEVFDFSQLETGISESNLQAKEIRRTDSLPADVMGRIVDITTEDDVITDAFTTLMGEIEDYVDGIINKGTVVFKSKGNVDKVAEKRISVISGTREEMNVKVFELPMYWSLQKVSYVKFNKADYWRDIADLNQIGNPMDKVEMYEGRPLALPRSAADKIG